MLLMEEEEGPSSSTQNLPSTKTINTFVTLPGQVHFRLLCHRDTAGGVIGHSGNIVKHIEFETGATIRISKPSYCIEHVISVIGYPTINKRIILQGYGEECDVSQAQEALIRVFERVLEVEGTAVGVIGCRLLELVGYVGAIMGRGGGVLDKIRKSTGAKVRVLPKEQLPECALPADELIQIMGSIVAVKKALVAITQRLQYKRQMERAEFSNSADYSPHVHQFSSNREKRLKPDEENSRQKVEFRLLCPVMTAGGVIGKNAFYVKFLENETSACIRFATSIVWANERVAMISAMEIPQPLYSAAQIATVCVLDRSIEIGEQMGIYKRDAVSARLLVSSKDVACLGDEVKVASDMNYVSGVDIQLLAGDQTLHCVAEFDKVLQITGAYENVKSALFQVTGRLRKNMFSSIDPHVLDPRHPHTSVKEMTHVQELDYLGFLGNDDSHCPPKLLHLQNLAQKI